MRKLTKQVQQYRCILINRPLVYIARSDKETTTVYYLD